MSIPRTNAGFGRKAFFFLSLLLPGISLKRQFLNPIWIIVTNVLLSARGWTQNSSDQSDFFGNRLAATGVVLMGLLIWIQQWRLLETFCCYALSYIRTGEWFFSRKESKERHWWLVLMEEMVLFLLGMSLIHQLAPLTKRSRTVDPIGWS